jgi:pSer/pThr/pTyr-binding forkhead associated (FHA) protein
VTRTRTQPDLRFSTVGRECSAGTRPTFRKACRIVPPSIPPSGPLIPHDAKARVCFSLDTTQKQTEFDMVVETTTEPTGPNAETATEPAGPNEWRIRDQVTSLREWGTDIDHPLPSTREPSSIGAVDGCWLRLWDLTGCVSRRHAELIYNELAGWTIADLNSKNGIHLDGMRMDPHVSHTLAPGVQIRIGGVTLVAESPMLRALQDLLERLIGWSDERREDVDRAIYSLRVAATYREPLLLSGAGNLVSIARSLHRHALGDRPFILCGPKASGLEALTAARGGTLCFWRTRLPADFDEVVAAVRGPASRVLLVICAHDLPRGTDIASQVVTVFRSIVLPPLSDRARELTRIIDAYADDAIAAFGGSLTPEDRNWIARNASGTLSQIEMEARRIVVLHACGESVKAASRMLGMSHGSISDWVARRALPGRSHVPAPDEDEE